MSDPAVAIFGPMEERTTNQRTLGERLRYALQVRHMKQTDVERVSGVSKQNISNWCRDNVKFVYPEHLIAVTNALAIRPEWLVTGRGPMSYDASSPAEVRDPDFKQLEYVVTEVISALGRRVLSLSTEKVGELIAAVYEVQLKSNNKLGTATIIRLIDRLAG